MWSGNWFTVEARLFARWCRILEDSDLKWLEQVVTYLKSFDGQNRVTHTSDSDIKLLENLSLTEDSGLKWLEKSATYLKRVTFYG